MVDKGKYNDVNKVAKALREVLWGGGDCHLGVQPS